MSKKRRKEIFAIGFVIVIMGSAAGYTLWKSSQEGQVEMVYSGHEAQRGTLQSIVTERGTVELGTTTQVYDIDVTTQEEDDEDDDEEESEDYLRVEEVYAAVGQRISEGDKICSFTQDSIEDVRKSLKYAVTDAQIELSNAQTAYNLGVLEAGLSHNETMLDAALAQASYDNTIARLSNDLAAKTLEIEQLLADIYQIQLDLTEDDYREQKADVTEAYEDAKEALEDASEDFVTNKVEAAQTFMTARESYENFFSQFDESNQQIEDKVNEVYAIQEEIAYNQQLLEKELLTAKQKSESSNISGSIADTKYQSSLTSYENALTSAQTALSEAEEKLAAFEEFVGDGTIYAAGSGIVTEISYEKDDYLVNAGTIISFAEAENMTITVDVSQEDVVTMKVGDSVSIAFTAYEGESYTGTIQSITTTATSRSAATISYPVVIAIEGDTSKLYGGMTADVTFITEEKDEVVYILSKAVTEENGKSYVYVQKDNDYVLTPVTTGFSNGESIEITTGLKEGDTYYIYQPAEKTEQENQTQKNENSGEGKQGNQMQDSKESQGMNQEAAEQESQNEDKMNHEKQSHESENSGEMRQDNQENPGQNGQWEGRQNEP